MLKRIGLRPRAAGLITFVATVAAIMLVAPSAFGAINTTDDPGQSVNGTNNTLACLNSPVNCNQYLQKEDVFLSGSPSSTVAGTYFFAVLQPSGQANPNDGNTDNLSWTAGDDVTSREFYVAADGAITYLGSPLTHLLAPDNKLSAWPYSNTSNHGGVYIMAVCKISDTNGFVASVPTVTASSCKYDAFKVKASETTPPGTASPPTITKDAAGSYKTTYTWNVAKSADKTKVQQIGGTASFTYTVHVTHDGGTISDVMVTGTITVFNSNTGTVTADVTDALSNSTTCDVIGGSGASLASGDNTFAYSCDLGSTLPTGALGNTATVTWADQTVDPDGDLAAGHADFTFTDVAFTGSNVGNCTTVTDPVPSGGTSNDNPFPQTVCVGGTGDGGAGTGTTDGFTFTYHVSYNVGTGCTSYTNTATESTDGNYSSVIVQVCGPANNSALTIGFWKNTNGNTLIQYYCAPSGKTSLASYLAGLGPFSDATGKSCAQLVTYVNNIIKGANAVNMNTMLKAQMLATALDVYFSDPSMGYTATSVSKTKPPSNLLTQGALGGFNMDMTAICPMVDNTTAGTATCGSSSKPSTNAFASGAVPSAAMTVQAILTFAATTPSPFNGSTSNSIWYAGNRTLEEVLKNVFDQINNNDAFGA